MHAPKGIDDLFFLLFDPGIDEDRPTATRHNIGICSPQGNAGDVAFIAPVHEGNGNFSLAINTGDVARPSVLVGTQFGTQWSCPLSSPEGCPVEGAGPFLSNLVVNHQLRLLRSP
jgi:hypothetical protein